MSIPHHTLSCQILTTYEHVKSLLLKMPIPCHPLTGQFLITHYHVKSSPANTSNPYHLSTCPFLTCQFLIISSHVKSSLLANMSTSQHPPTCQVLNVCKFSVNLPCYLFLRLVLRKLFFLSFYTDAPYPTFSRNFHLNTPTHAWACARACTHTHTHTHTLQTPTDT